MRKEDLKAGYLLEVKRKDGSIKLHVLMPMIYFSEETLGMTYDLNSSIVQQLYDFGPFDNDGFELLAVYGLPGNSRHRVWREVSKEDRPLLWEKPKTKKVFRLWKYLESQVKKAGYKSLTETLIFMKNVSSDWIYKCDGVTVEDCHKLGYLIKEEWLVEESEE
jgi:hypothetical protein